jgi:hypothetical protein
LRQTLQRLAPDDPHVIVIQLRVFVGFVSESQAKRPRRVFLLHSFQLTLHSLTDAIHASHCLLLSQRVLCVNLGRFSPLVTATFSASLTPRRRCLARAGGRRSWGGGAGVAAGVVPASRAGGRVCSRQGDGNGRRGSMRRLKLRVVVQHAVRSHGAPCGGIKVLEVVEIAEVRVARLGIEQAQVSSYRENEY